MGTFGGKLVRPLEQQFVPAKASIVIPNRLEYGVEVLDIKQENDELTSGWRANQGQEFYLFDPFARNRRTHR